MYRLPHVDKCMYAFSHEQWNLVHFHLPSLFSLVTWLHQFLVAIRIVFSCGMWGLVPGIQPRPPALGAWSLSHWTPREVLTQTLIVWSPRLPGKIFVCRWHLSPSWLPGNVVCPSSHR